MFKRSWLVLAVTSALMMGCSSQEESSIPEPEQSVDVVEVVVEPTEEETVIAEPVTVLTPTEQADYSGVAYTITEKGFPKTYAAWGESWIGNINTAMPLAVIRAASNPKCDSPIAADLSDNRSIPGEKVVFYVDCANRERFYVDMDELTETKALTAESDMLSSNAGEYMLACEGLIKEDLENPSSFDYELLDTNTFKGSSGNMVVEIPFIAIDDDGEDLDLHARCVFSTTGENEVTITER